MFEIGCEIDVTAYYVRFPSEEKLFAHLQRQRIRMERIVQPAATAATVTASTS